MASETPDPERARAVSGDMSKRALIRALARHLAVRTRVLAAQRNHEHMQTRKRRKTAIAVVLASSARRSSGAVSSDWRMTCLARSRRTSGESIGRRSSASTENSSSLRNRCSSDHVGHEHPLAHAVKAKRQQLPIGLRGCEHFDWLELRQRLLHLRQLGLRECQRQDEVSHVRGFTADPFPQDLVHDLVAKISDDRICNRSLRRVDVKATSPGITVSLEVARQSIRESIDRPLDSVSQMQARVEADATRDQAVAPSTSARRKMRGVRAMRRMRSMRMMRVMSRA